MGRTILSPKNKIEIQREYIGKIILFCEGMSEKHYLDYFKDIISKNKFTEIKIETESADGNARTVFNFAEDFLSKDENISRYMYHKKYLVFDCDDPSNIQDVIRDMNNSSNNYSLLVSNYRFETWLLMHFEHIYDYIRKPNISKHLTNHLKHEYKKADAGIIREIINNGNVEEAIKNGYELENKYQLEGKTILSNIKEMNPYTNIHTIIEQFMLEISSN